VFIDHLRGTRRFEAGAGAVHYSVITRCELYAGRSSEEERVDTLLEPFLELGVDRQIASRAGRLRRDLPIRMPDALIAATALERRLTLLTRNRKHFELVPGLTVQAP
jgi:predicted nucleic acid-binding protein